jgi:hypothetical protein
LFANFMVYLTRELHLDQVYASNILYTYGVSLIYLLNNKNK